MHTSYGAVMPVKLLRFDNKNDDNKIYCFYDFEQIFLLLQLQEIKW